MLHARAGMNGETAHMRFINHGLRPGMPERPVVMPVEVLVSEHAFRHGSGIIDCRTNQVLLWRRRIVSPRRAKTPIRQRRDRCRKGVQEQLVEIETMSFPGFIRSIHPVGVKLTGTNSLNPYVPYVTRAVARGIEINHSGGRCVCRKIKQLQPNAAGVTAK